MRTKTLLLSAALTAAGVCSSLAQVYSVNAVGYVNLTVPQAGKISTDLFFPKIDGTQVYIYNGTAYDGFLFDVDTWVKSGVANEPNIAIAQSFWVRNNGPATTWDRVFSVNP